MKRLFAYRVVAVITLFALLSVSLISPVATFATDTPISSNAFSGFMMSPMTSIFTLDPGATHSGSFYLVNPDQNTIPVDYELAVQSFYRDESSNAIFEDVEGRGQLAQWITLNVPTSGTIQPGEFIEITFTVNVPVNAPSGGQYAAITATSAVNSGENAIIQESVVMAHTIFAEINGQTVHDSRIDNPKLRGFLLDGPITASSTVVNTGNVHGIASFSIEVKSPFTGETLYSNSSEPDKHLILPDRSYTNESTWNDTPAFGIFNVTYTVDFDGNTYGFTSVVVKCPIWLILIMVIILLAIILSIVLAIKHHRKASVVS